MSSSTVSIIPSADPTKGLLYSPSTAAESARVVRESPGTIYGLTAVNTGGVAQFVQIYDLAGTPGLAAQPVWSLPIAANSSLNIDFGPYGIGLTTGIAIGNSTTAATRTAGASDCLFYPRFK
jgi:hypothetical protein